MDHHVLVQMRNDWNTRALENAEHYVANAQEQWERREFFRSGRDIRRQRSHAGYG